MALAEADLHGLAYTDGSKSPNTASPQAASATPDTANQADDFQGFDPRGTLTRRRAPSSSASSAPRRSTSLSLRQQQPSSASSPSDLSSPALSPNSSSALSSGLLRRSSALRNTQPSPVRQVGFPSPSSIPQISKDEKSSPCPAEKLSESLEQQNFFPVQEITTTPRDGSNATPVPFEDPPIARGRRSSRPDHLRSSSYSSSREMSSISRSRSRHPPSLRDQLFERESSRTRNRSPATSRTTSTSPYSHMTSSDSDSLERSSTPWSPAQEFLSGLRKGNTEDSTASLMDSVMSLGTSADKYGQGVEVDGWKIGHFLGAGSFGHVRTCKRLDGPSQSTGYRIGPGQLAAVKIVPLAQDAHLNAEIEIWSNLPPHDSVLPLLGVHTAEYTGFVFMPLCEGGNLLEYLQNYGEAVASGIGPVRPGRPRGRRTISNRRPNASEDSANSSSTTATTTRGGLPFTLAKQIFVQIVAGLAHLHANGVVHCDVKLENILLDNKRGRFRLADFGMAQAHAADISAEILAERDGHPASFTEGFTAPPSLEASLLGREQTPPPMMDSPAGSLEYAAPERLKMTAASPGIKAAVDIWALGCVLYALISGSLPFQDSFEPRLRMKILGGSWDVPQQLMTLSSDRQCNALLKLLQNCLHMDEEARWTIAQVQASEWLTTNWNDEVLLEDQPLPRPPRRGSSSRSQSRGRRGIGIDTEAQCPSTAEWSPYARTHRSRSRDSSGRRDSPTSTGSRRRNTSSGPFSRVPMTLSE